MVAATTQRPGQQVKGKPIITRPFRVGAQSRDELQYDQTASTSTSTVDLPNLVVQPTGYLRHLYLLVEATCTGNSATVTAAADGPFNVFDTIQFNDVGNKPILGPLTGWDLYVINKYGGYDFNDDPRNSPAYSYTTGSGSSGGSFTFALRIPIELVARDALGCLPNQSATSTYTLRMRLTATTNIYGTDPTNAPSVRVRVQPVSWWEPDPTDLKGRPQAVAPPALQTTQFWQKNPYTVNAGVARVPLEGVGWPIRELVYYLTDSNGSRSQGESDWPDPFELRVDTTRLVSRLKTLWKDQMARSYGYGGALSDSAAGGKDNSVYVEPFCVDFGPKPGWETRRGYLPTTQSTRLEVEGTIGGSGSHTFTVLMCYVAPANGDDASITV
jgi:hypothetical protein